MRIVVGCGMSSEDETHDSRLPAVAIAKAGLTIHDSRLNPTYRSAKDNVYPGCR